MTDTQATPSSRSQLPTPSKDHIATLPLFQRLDLKNIIVVASAQQALQAKAALQGARVLGFDTESKPTFKVGEVSTGPHIVQLATIDTAYIFQLTDPVCRELVCDVLTSNDVLKVGFGLSGDHTQILRTLGVEPAHVLDINSLFKAQGYTKEIGVKSAVAVLFNQRFVKSRKATTSNWSNANLTEAQLIYAANDAWAALRVFEAINSSHVS
jgi:ribonuclease D